MNDNYTSRTLSKKLKENGCKIESEHARVGSRGELVAVDELKKDYDDGAHYVNLVDKFRAYDLLWDICVRHADKFFPKAEFSCGTMINCPHDRASQVLWYLYRGKKQEAEDYIWENCKFNPSNK